MTTIKNFREVTREANDFRFINVSALIIKVTNVCNIDCSYCYENISKHGGRMDKTIFEQIVEKTLCSTLSKRVQFIFHGGEPTILEMDWYKNAVSFANERASYYGKKAVFGLQSNFVNISEKKLALFNDLGIHLCASLDGPSSIKSSLRENAEKANRTFIKAKEMGLNPSVLLTINQSNFNYFNQILHWLEHELKVKAFKANTVYSVGNGQRLKDMNPEMVFEAHKTIIDYLIETKASRVVEQNLVREIKKYFRDDSAQAHHGSELCGSKICGAGKRVLGISHEGEILPCGRFNWNDKQYFLGHIQENIQEENFTSSVDRFQNLVPTSWFDCGGCSASKICNFGCQAFIVRSKSNANVECLPTKMKYNYFKEKHTELKQLMEAIDSKSNLSESEYEYSDYDDTSYSDYFDTYNDFSH